MIRVSSVLIFGYLGVHLSTPAVAFLYEFCLHFVVSRTSTQREGNAIRRPQSIQRVVVAGLKRLGGMFANLCDEQFAMLTEVAICDLSRNQKDFYRNSFHVQFSNLFFPDMATMKVFCCHICPFDTSDQTSLTRVFDYKKARFVNIVDAVVWSQYRLFKAYGYV